MNKYYLSIRNTAGNKLYLRRNFDHEEETCGWGPYIIYNNFTKIELDTYIEDMKKQEWYPRLSKSIRIMPTAHS